MLEVKESILVIARAENARKRQQERRKARGNFEKQKPFKFTKKLFEGDKNGVLFIPKEELEAYHRKKYTNLLADLSLGRSHPPKEKTDNSPFKLGEIKDYVGKARTKSSSEINGISY